MHLVTRAYMLIQDYPSPGKVCFLDCKPQIGSVTQLIDALDCGVSPLPPKRAVGIRRRLGGVYTVHPRVPNGEYSLYIIPDSDDPESFIWFRQSMTDAYRMHLELEGVYNTPERVAALQALGFIESPDAAIQPQGVGE